MLSIEEFKKSLSRFASGVTIVTYTGNGESGGITVSSFSSLSMDPPLVLFSINRSVGSHEKLLQSSHFCIHILSREQETLSNQFSSSKIDKNELLRNISIERKEEIPLLPGSLSRLFCERFAIYEGGDHSIFIGKVLSAETDESKEPLLYYNRGYRTLMEGK